MTIHDAINYAVKVNMERREKRVMNYLGLDLDWERKLAELGIQITGISCASNGDYPEISGILIPGEHRYSYVKEIKNRMQPSRPTPKKVIFSGPATTILWTDGTKTTVKCSDEDVWEDEVGIAMCYLKKLLGNKGNYNNIFREAMKVAVVAESKTKNTSAAIDNSTYVKSAFDNMTENIDRINKCMKDAADALSNAVKEKK